MAKGGYQKRRIAEKKQRERKARKRQERNKKILTGTIVVVLLAMIGAITFVALTGDGDLAATPTPSASVSPSEQPDTSAKFATPCTKLSSVKKNQKMFTDPPCKIIKDNRSYSATFQTSMGKVEVELLAADAPVTVNNFVFLARAGFFDGSIFHRVIPDFGGKGSNMVQGGDAVNRDGTGDPGYSFGDENFLPFDKPGYLAMANSGPGSNGSQFFFLDGTVSHLNAPGACPGSGCHSVFGRVSGGLKVVGEIATVKRGEGDKPVKDVVLRKVTIEETRR